MHFGSNGRPRLAMSRSLMMVAYAMELSVRFATETFVPLVGLGSSSRGLWLLILSLCVHGVNAKPLKEHSRNETVYALGWFLMFCFCLQCLQWLLYCILHTCKHICKFCYSRRPNLSLVLVAVWCYCSYVTVAIAMPYAHLLLPAPVFCPMRIAINTLLHGPCLQTASGCPAFASPSWVTLPAVLCERGFLRQKPKLFCSVATFKKADVSNIVGFGDHVKDANSTSLCNVCALLPGTYHTQWCIKE